MSAQTTETAPTIRQLPVDIFQSQAVIIIQAQLPGSDVADVRVSIEGDANIVIIEGSQYQPIPTGMDTSGGTYVVTEGMWGRFYRRIILPVSVEIEKSHSQIKNGVLTVHLPTR